MTSSILELLITAKNSDRNMKRIRAPGLIGLSMRVAELALGLKCMHIYKWDFRYLFGRLILDGSKKKLVFQGK